MLFSLKAIWYFDNSFNKGRLISSGLVSFFNCKKEMAEITDKNFKLTYISGENKEDKEDKEDKEKKGEKKETKKDEKKGEKKETKKNDLT